MSIRKDMLVQTGHYLLFIFVPLLVLANGDSLIDGQDYPGIERVNYVLGTQSIGIKYHFTEETGLVETARRIHEMGSNVMKFSMTRRYSDKDRYNLERNERIQSLVDLAKHEPSMNKVLSMPFKHYHIWVYSFAHNENAWVNGLSQKERDDEYEEIYSLTKYLLENDRFAGKTFYLGHWEGDWYLSYNPGDEVTPTKIQGMIDWLNVRQEAIEDAIDEVGSSSVQVYHYTEVNLVQKGMMGEKCLVNEVLPHTSVDYVSYSCYDTIYPHMGDVGPHLHKALDYIESKLPSKEGIPGKRVFIGEYGFSLERALTPEKQDLFSRDVCRAALEWGCPFVLYWEFYCNENPEGKHRGFWLIDDQDRKQPFYHTLKNYYQEMQQYVVEYHKDFGRLPSDLLIRQRAIEFLKRSSDTTRVVGNPDEDSHLPE